MNQITLDGIEYTRTDTIQSHASAGRFIVVLDRGWIAVGNLSQDDNGDWRISNCKNVRSWAKLGFGGLTRGATSSGAVLNGCADIVYSRSAEIFRVPISDGWENE